MRALLRLAVLAVFLAAPVAAQPPPSQVASFLAEAGPVGVYPVVDGLEHPWGMTFLPDGRMLVTERPGRLRLVDPEASGPPATVKGTPTVYAQGQGGPPGRRARPRLRVQRLRLPHVRPARA